MLYSYIPRVPQCLSPRRNWDPPPPSPLPQASVYPYETEGGGKHSPAGEGVGEFQCGWLEKKPSTLSTLWWYYTYLTWEVGEWYHLTWRWWQGTVPPLCKLYQNFSTLLTISKLSQIKFGSLSKTTDPTQKRFFPAQRHWEPGLGRKLARFLHAVTRMVGCTASISCSARLRRIGQ